MRRQLDLHCKISVLHSVLKLKWSCLGSVMQINEKLLASDEILDIVVSFGGDDVVEPADVETRNTLRDRIQSCRQLLSDTLMRNTVSEPETECNKTDFGNCCD